MTDKFQSESTLAFPGEVHQTPSGGVLVSKLDDVINWARSIHYGHWYLAPVAVQ